MKHQGSSGGLTFESGIIEQPDTNGLVDLQRRRSLFIFDPLLPIGISRDRIASHQTVPLGRAPAFCRMSAPSTLLDMRAR